MSELIDIWRVIELLSDKRCDCNFFVDGQTAYEALSDMIKAVKELPRIDLVRCGECKKWREDDGDMICGISELICNADDFCSRGERRTDEHTDAPTILEEE